MSAKIQQIIEVIEEVRDEFRVRPEVQNLYQSRLQATRSIAERKEIKQQTVNDKLLRQLRPDINSLGEFDKLLEDWLIQGSDQLRLVLQKHAHDLSDQELIGNAFYLASEADVKLAQEFDFDPNEKSFKEGKDQLRIHLIKERNRFLVNQAKAEWMQNTKGNVRCEVCGFAFLEIYGELGKGFVEAHHKFPISKLATETIVKISDLAPVCSNCHSMLHRSRPWLAVEQLKNIVEKQVHSMDGQQV